MGIFRNKQEFSGSLQEFILTAFTWFTCLNIKHFGFSLAGINLNVSNVIFLNDRIFLKCFLTETNCHEYWLEYLS